MRKSTALAAVLLALSGCGPNNLRQTVKRFRQAGKVYALVDGNAFFASMDKALAEDGKATVHNSQVSFLRRDGLLMVYTTEALVPPLKGFSPLSPHQAAELAAKDGIGICVNPDAAAGCSGRLTPEEAAAMAEVLHGDGVPRERFAMLVKKE